MKSKAYLDTWIILIFFLWLVIFLPYKLVFHVCLFFM